MKTINLQRKETYVSPDTEEIFVSFEKTILSDTGEPIGGGNEPDIPID